MKIAIVTIATKECDSYARYTNEIKIKYCAKHGYDFLLHKETLNPDKHIYWSKIPAMRMALKAGNDWAIWMDADCAPVNMDLPFNFNHYIPQEYTIGKICCMMSKDVLGYNCGVFALRNCKESFDFLDWLETDDVYNRYRTNPFPEQNAMAEYFNTHVDFCCPLPYGFNNYDNIYPDYHNGIPNEYKKGNWCLHVPGYNNRYRAVRFSNILKSIDKVKCPICCCDTEHCFEVPFDKSCTIDIFPKEATKHEGKMVSYNICPNCEYIFAPEFLDWDDETFQKEIYNEEYEKYFDPTHSDENGIEERAIMHFNRFTRDIYNRGDRHLDYGGGHGGFSRLLRERCGIQSDCYDKFYNPKINIYNKYSLITCFEVLEHTVNPISIFFDFNNNTIDTALVITQTQLYDISKPATCSMKDWWYVAPRNGHISFYATRTMQYLADQFEFRYIKEVSNGVEQYFKKI